MKKLFSVVGVGSVLILLVAGAAQAQPPGTAIRASIPFDFIVRGRTLPAGHYEIRRISDEPTGLLIRNVDDKHDKALFETEGVYMRRIAGKNELVFNRYGGDTYYLSEVETAGEQLAREVYPSRSERHLRQQMAKNQVEPETVTVACY